MAEINQAYAILSDPLRRRSYDASLATNPHPRTRYHATNFDSHRSNSSPPLKKSAHEDDLTAPYFSMTPFLIVSLICFIIVVVYLVLFYMNDGSANANGELVKLRELVESIAKKELYTE
jgi:curved DNA-binding protein CbpA